MTLARRAGAVLARGVLPAALVAGTGCHRSRPAAVDHVSAEAETCRSCHRDLVESYLRTAHFGTTAEPGPGAIAGSFVEGRNRLRTGSGITFTMTRRADAFTVTATDSARGHSRTERVGMVIGSGRKGQTYLYWKDGVLLELPVSWLTSAGQWINSPGYTDGEANFERIVPPRCLECHSTAFRLEPVAGGARYADDYQLGIGCAKCHGDARRHVEYQVSHPGDSTARFVHSPARGSRDQRVDECRVCHGGPLQLRQPPFSYRPGLPVADFFGEPTAPGQADVHGNQVALLRDSKCFVNSPEMTCSTCHDVHRTERELEPLGQKCLGCHVKPNHRTVAAESLASTAGCVGCHMPNRPSDGLKLTTPGVDAISYRSHRIAVYPGATGRD